MYHIYLITITLLFLLLLPLLPLIALVRQKNRIGLSQRLGFGLSSIPEKSENKRIWFHAASVGEVQAARVLIAKILEQRPESEIVLSTMTPHGLAIAREQLPAEVKCFIAPLDVPFIVGRVVRQLSPDMYVCIETELWPAMLRCLKKRSVPALLLNGRISPRSLVTYNHVRGFFSRVLNNFMVIGSISRADQQRFLQLGADPERCTVTGNVKYDLPLPDGASATSLKYRQLLSLSDQAEVFISGSTHPGEEEQLLRMYKRLSANDSLIWLTAPRHMERVVSLERFFKDNNLGFDKFTELRSGKKREHPVILVDVMGELSSLYGIATFVFCGGSLVERGGHNVMEAALWGKYVFYGPSMTDYRDAVAMLEAAEAGCMVKDTEELFTKISYFRDNQLEYHEACKRAGKLSSLQVGSSAKQMGYILEWLDVEG